MSLPFPIPLSEQIAEVERELGLRRSVYPRLIDQKKMSERAAELHMKRLEAALATLRRVQKLEPNS